MQYWRKTITRQAHVAAQRTGHTDAVFVRTKFQLLDRHWRAMVQVCLYFSKHTSTQRAWCATASLHKIRQRDWAAAGCGFRTAIRGKTPRGHDELGVDLASPVRAR